MYLDASPGSEIGFLSANNKGHIYEQGLVDVNSLEQYHMIILQDDTSFKLEK